MRGVKTKSFHLLLGISRAVLVVGSVLILAAASMGRSAAKQPMKTRNMHVVARYDVGATGSMAVFKDHHRWYLLVRGNGPNGDALIDVTKPSKPALSDAAAKNDAQHAEARSQEGDQATAHLTQGYTRFQLRVADDGLHVFDITDATNRVEVASSIPQQPADTASVAQAGPGRLEIDRRGYIYFEDRFGRLWILTLDNLADDEMNGGGS